MSRSLNKVTLIGNLGADPEVRSIANGGKVATVSLATGRQWKGADGNTQEKTQWHRIVFWNSSGKGPQFADLVERYCKKGDKLFVEGELEYRTWQDKDGQTKYTTEIRGSELIFLSGKGGGDGSEGATWAGAKASAKSAAAPAAGAKKEFDDLPDALDAEDDDLPF